MKREEERKRLMMMRGGSRKKETRKKRLRTGRIGEGKGKRSRGEWREEESGREEKRVKMK